MSSAPQYNNINYATLSKYLILNDPTYETLEHGVNINWDHIDASLQGFTPITDAKLHANLDYMLMNQNFRVKNTARKYKVIPARSEISDVLLLGKAMDNVLQNDQISLQDFVLFAYPNTKLEPQFESEITALLQVLNNQEYQHIDCVLLDYGYLGKQHNVINLVANHAKLQKDPMLAYQLETTQIFKHLEFIPGTVKLLKGIYIIYDKNQNSIYENNLDLTIGVPACMGLSYTQCFLIRKSRIKSIRKHRKANWLAHDFKRYIPISRILIVAPSLVTSSFPQYDLTISTEDILELNRQFIQHTQPIDTYRKVLYQRIPWIYKGITHHNFLIRWLALIGHKILFWC